MTCSNCSKSIRTDAGMAFHRSWCKPAPVARPGTPKARKARHARRHGPIAVRAARAREFARPLAIAQRWSFYPGDFAAYHLEAESADVAAARVLAAWPDARIAGALAYVAPDGFAPACLNVGPDAARTAGATIETTGAWRVSPAPYPYPVVTRPAETSERCSWLSTDGYGCNFAAGHVGWHERHQAPESTPDDAPTQPNPTPVPTPVPTRKARTTRARKAGTRDGLPYADGAVSIAGGRVRVSREAEGWSTATLADADQIARGKSWKILPSVLDKDRPVFDADATDPLGPWSKYGPPAPKAAPVARKRVARPHGVGPGACYCARGHAYAPATATAQLDPFRYVTRFAPRSPVDYAGRPYGADVTPDPFAIAA